ncbi:hypothetical protein [Streptomyces atratus]|uniref:Uncharacterized protein n=1 Tax=Streptomyces atratus TaxID=1893 RepID=A0A1K1YES2_STRAR|nr:hypothetical protein SAMN02787144_1004253 [Streptomyces atratus]
MEAVLAEFDDDTGTPAFTTRVPCSEYFPVRDRALLAHATQIDPNAGFMLHDRDIEREVWPTEDFHLARSQVEVSLPEDDLFAGVRPGPHTALASGGGAAGQTVAYRLGRRGCAPTVKKCWTETRRGSCGRT